MVKEVKKTVKQLKKETMDLSVKEAGFAGAQFGVGESYIIPYALALNFNNFQIGLFRSITSFFPSIFQYYGSKLMEKWDRKKIIISFVMLQALMWFSLMSFAYLFWKGLLVDYIPYMLIVAYTFLAIFGSIAVPSWFSLLGDIVPAKFRGRYFSNRNRVYETVLLLSFLAGAFFLDYFKTKGWVLLGFAILMFLAGMFRFICSLYFRKHYYPKLEIGEKAKVGFRHFIKHISRFNFGRFSIFTTLMYFSVSVCGAFFSVYMLKDLGFSYTTFMIISIAGSIFHLVSLPIWGKVSDKFGNRTLISIGAFCIAIMPFLWLFSVNPIYLICVPQLIIGLGWSAFGLGTTNFVYDSVPKQRRGFFISYQHILMSLGIFIGSFIGGILAQYLPKIGLSNLPLLFIISGVLRVLTIAIFLPQIREVRKVKPMHFNDLRLMTVRTYVYGHHHHLILFKKIKDLENSLAKIPHNLFVKFFKGSNKDANKFLNRSR